MSRKRAKQKSKAGRKSGPKAQGPGLGEGADEGAPVVEARADDEAVPEEVLAEGSGEVDLQGLVAAAEGAMGEGPEVALAQVDDDEAASSAAPEPAEGDHLDAAVATSDDGGEVLFDATGDQVVEAGEGGARSAAGDVVEGGELGDDAIADDLNLAQPDGGELEPVSDEEVAAILPTGAVGFDATQLKHLIEALIFASDKPVTLPRLRQLTRIGDVKRLQGALAELAADYAPRGIVLTQISGGYQFRTRTAYSAWVQQLVAGRPVRLSRAQLETLAIVAYRQPITRPEIDQIRGVDSGGTLKVLLDRELIRVLGKREEVGRPILYGTTKEFLDFFSLGDLRELPTLREYSELNDESRQVMTKMGLDAPAPAVAPEASGGGGVAEGDVAEGDVAEGVVAEGVVAEGVVGAAAGEEVSTRLDGDTLMASSEGVAAEAPDGAGAGDLEGDGGEGERPPAADAEARADSIAARMAARYRARRGLVNADVADPETRLAQANDAQDGDAATLAAEDDAGDDAMLAAEDDAAILATGDDAAILATGDDAAILATGDAAAILATGDAAAILATGDDAAIAPMQAEAGDEMVAWGGDALDDVGGEVSAAELAADLLDAPLAFGEPSPVLEEEAADEVGHFTEGEADGVGVTGGEDDVLLAHEVSGDDVVTPEPIDD